MSKQTPHYHPKTIGNINRRYANQLGWKAKYHQIKFILGITKTLPEPMDFAHAVANWQSQNPPLKTDGLLGPKTWKRMKHLTRMNAPSMSPLPSWLRMNTRIRVKYNVPMKRQGISPICWVACVAMMLSYKNRSSIQISSLTGGLNPSTSSIPKIPDWKKVMRSEGFEFGPHYGQRPNEQYLADMLRTKGPLFLFHYTTTIWNTPDLNSTHAVVITGIDTAKDVCYINNPQRVGIKDQVIPTDTVLNAIAHLWAINHPALIYLGVTRLPLCCCIPF